MLEWNEYKKKRRGNLGGIINFNLEYESEVQTLYTVSNYALTVMTFLSYILHVCMSVIPG